MVGFSVTRGRCWLVCSLSVTKTPWSFSARLLAILLPPNSCRDTFSHRAVVVSREPCTVLPIWPMLCIQGRQMKGWCEAWPVNEKGTAHNLDYNSQRYCKEIFNFSCVWVFERKIKHLPRKQTLLLKGFILQTPSLPRRFPPKNNFSANLSISATVNPSLPHSQTLTAMPMCVFQLAKLRCPPWGVLLPSPLQADGWS